MADLSSCYQPDSDCADEIRKGNPPPCKIFKREVKMREQIAMLIPCNLVKCNYSDGSCLDCPENINIVDQILTIVKAHYLQEIAKVENPYGNVDKSKVFESAREAIKKQIGG